MTSICEEQYRRELEILNVPFDNAFWLSQHGLSTAKYGDLAHMDEETLADHYYKNGEPEEWRTACPLGHIADVLVDGDFEDAYLTYQFPDRDVVLSLAPRDTDDLVLHRASFSDKSPFYRAALSERWLNASGREKSDKPIRFELVYEEDGGSVLVQKPSTTPWLQRLKSDNRALRETYEGKQKQFDDQVLDAGILACHRGFRSCDSGDPCDDWRRLTIQAYKVVIGLMLDIDIDYHTKHHRFWSIRLI